MVEKYSTILLSHGTGVTYGEGSGRAYVANCTLVNWGYALTPTPSLLRLSSRSILCRSSTLPSEHRQASLARLALVGGYALPMHRHCVLCGGTASIKSTPTRFYLSRIFLPQCFDPLLKTLRGGIWSATLDDIYVEFYLTEPTLAPTRAYVIRSRQGCRSSNRWTFCCERDDEYQRVSRSVFVCGGSKCWDIYAICVQLLFDSLPNGKRAWIPVLAVSLG